MIATNSSFDGCGPLKQIENIHSWIDQTYEYGNPMQTIEDNQFLIT